MRFRRVRVDAFGALREVDTGPDPLPGLVVVLGPNEAGKSTFFHFLSALLYGFYPASRDTHPLAPWGGADAAGSAEVVLADGSVAEVHRVLQSSPGGSVVRGERQEELRNRTVPWARHVPRKVYGQVFALTLDELGALHGESWVRVQERLITGMGSGELANPREVADALEDEAGRLWRPNKRGNQEIREMRSRLRELVRARRDAAEADRELREADRELERVRDELERAREEREQCRLYVERYRALLPLRDQLRRIDRLDEEAGPPELLEGLPSEPAERLAELRSEVEEAERRRAELSTRVAEVRRTADAYGDDAAALVERREAIRGVVGRVAGLKPDLVRLGQVEQEGADLGRRAEGLAGELFGERAAELDGALDRLALPRIREAADALRRVREQGAEVADVAADPASGGPEAEGSPLLVGGAALALLGFAVVAGTLAGLAPGWAAQGGWLLVALGAAGAGTGWGSLRRARSDRRAAEARREAREASEVEARRRLREALADAPVREDLVESPPADLADRLGRLRDLRRDLEDRRAREEEIRGRVGAARDELHRLGEELDRELPGDPDAAAHLLDEALREAERLRERAGAAEEEAERVEAELRRQEERSRGARERLEELEARLRALGDGDVESGVEAARVRSRSRERARQLREDLRRSHHDLAALRERIRAAEASGEDWAVDDQALARRRAREETLTGRIEELVQTAQGLEKDLEHAGRRPTMDALDGEIDALRREIDDRVRERDRKAVLAALVREADRRFREAHQPDILRRAGKYLARITDGRYDRVLVAAPEDAASSDGSFLLQGEGAPRPVPLAEPISTGTREQAYLSLRLAVVDHLDQDGERLPLVMDEAFVNWDPERRRGGFDLVAEAARTRQVFVFTCHPPMAEALEARGARVIGLR